MDIKNKIEEIISNNIEIGETENRLDYIVHNTSELAEEIVKLFTIPVVSGCVSDFYSDLMNLINAYCKKGLKKPELVNKMEYATESCKLS